MIHLTRLNHIPLVVNSDLIEHIEITPDTVIALTTGQKFLVLETPDEVIERVIRFRQAIFDGPRRLTWNHTPAQESLSRQSEAHGA